MAQPATTHDSIILRAELLEQITNQLAKTPVMLNASAGFGKTTLCQQLDNTLTSSKKTTVALDCSLCSDTEKKTFLSELPKSISAGKYILIDNIHYLEKNEAPLLEKAIIRVQKASGSMVLTGRGAGFLSLSRLIIDRCLSVIDANRLCFSQGEVNELTASLSAEKKAHNCKLYESTKGWPVAVNCLLNEDEGTLLGMPRLLYRYISETFYDRLDVGLRAAIRDSSILDSFSEASFLHVSNGVSWSHSLLDLLPVFPSQNHNDEWCFHPFLKKFLLSKLDAECMDGARDAHKRAAMWFQRSGDHYRAAGHAIETDNASFTVKVLDAGARHFIAVGRVDIALDWLNYLDDIDKHLAPHVRLFRATALIFSLRFKEAEAEHQKLLDLVEREHKKKKPATWAQELEAQSRHHKCLMNFFNPDEDVDHNEIEKIISDYQNTGLIVSGETATLNGIAYYAEGRFEEAEKMFHFAMERVTNSRSWLALAYCYISLAGMDFWCDSVTAAIGRLTDCLETFDDAGITDSPIYAFVSAHLANYYLYKGNNEKAYESIDTIVSNYGPLAPNDRGTTMLLLGNLYISQNQTRKALNIYQQANAIEGLQPNLKGKLQIATAKAHLLNQDTEKARATLPKTHFPPRADTYSSEESSVELSSQILDLQIKIAENNNDDKLSFGKQCIKRANNLQIYPLIIEAMCTTAVAFKQAEDTTGSTQRLLSEALDMARRTGCSGSITLFPLAALRQLLNEIKASTEEHNPALSEYVETLLNTPLSPEAQDIKTKTIPAVMPSLLTQKERQILNLLALGYSNKRVASTLMVSITTTKWHVRNILSKLNAKNRSEAVAQGRLANLIS